MPPLRLVRVLKKPLYAGLTILLAGGVLLVYIFTQVLGNMNNVDVWVANLVWWRGVLVGVFVLLFGITMSYQISLWTGPRTCSLEKKAKGTGASGLSTIGIFLVAQCPACASLGAFFLPLSAVTFLGQYAEWLNLASIGLMIFTLNYLGAFEREK
jgi:hypothetical protein